LKISRHGQEFLRASIETGAGWGGRTKTHKKGAQRGGRRGWFKGLHLKSTISFRGKLQGGNKGCWFNTPLRPKTICWKNNPKVIETKKKNKASGGGGRKKKGELDREC